MAKQENQTTVQVKVSEKGAISFYGLGGRFPVTLYRGQLEGILDREAALRQFIKANEAKLAASGAGKPVTGATAI